MKKILAMLLVLLVLVGCTTANNNNNEPQNNNNGVAATTKVVFQGNVYEETEEVSETLASNWSYSGSIKEVVADADIAGEHDVNVSNSLPVGTEIFAEIGNEESIVIQTGDDEFTVFSIQE